MKRSKNVNKIRQPDYALYVICASSVLFVFGTVAWLVLSAKQVGRIFQEKVLMHVYLTEGVNYEEERRGLVARLESVQAVKKVVYKDKSHALREWFSLGGEDFIAVTHANVLPESLEVSFNGGHVNPAQIRALKSVLDEYSIVADVQYPFELFGQFELIRKVTLYLSIFGCVLAVVSIAVLTYLIKLVVYNNRFIIRTMVLVGASNRLITRPFERRSLWNGLMSASVATAVLYFALQFACEKIPELRLVYSHHSFLWIAACIFVVGVFISWLGMFVTVCRYLKASSLEKFY